MRYYARWPAFIDDLFEKINDAITLDSVVDTVFDIGKSKFELANATLSDEGLKDAGVTDPQLFKSLGIFGLILLGLIVAIGIYLLLQFIDSKITLLRNVRLRL